MVLCQCTASAWNCTTDQIRYCTIEPNCSLTWPGTTTTRVVAVAEEVVLVQVVVVVMAWYYYYYYYYYYTCCTVAPSSLGVS